MQRFVTTDLLDGAGLSAQAVLFDEAGGVQIRADTRRPFCTLGITVLHVGPVLPDTIDVLEATVADLERLSRHKLKALVLASVWRQRGTRDKGPNRHAEGRAIDIGGVWWTEGWSCTGVSFPRSPKLYLSVEAVLRRNWGTVLAFHSNEQHEDHFHCDTGQPVGLSTSELSGKNPKAEVRFIQWALCGILDRRVRIDGRWGPHTEAAVLNALEEAGRPTNIEQPYGWLGFLELVAERGFEGELG